MNLEKAAEIFESSERAVLLALAVHDVMVDRGDVPLARSMWTVATDAHAAATAAGAVLEIVLPPLPIRAGPGYPVPASDDAWQLAAWMSPRISLPREVPPPDGDRREPGRGESLPAGVSWLRRRKATVTPMVWMRARHEVLWMA